MGFISNVLICIEIDLTGAFLGVYRNGPGECPFCFKSVQKLSYHVEDKHIPNPTPCTECGKMFSSTNKMRNHRSTSHRQRIVNDTF